MPKKQKNGWSGESILDADRLMPEDFLFLLLRLINYPHDPVPEIPAEHIKKLRFRQADPINLKRFLTALAKDTDIRIIPEKDNADFAAIEVPSVAVSAIQRAIDNYLKKMVAGTLIPIDENYNEFKRQRRSFLKILQEKIDAGVSKNFFITNSDLKSGDRLFEIALLLEREHYFKITNIYNVRDSNKPEYYKVVISANKKKIQLADTESDDVHQKKTLRLGIENGKGYLKYSKNGKKIPISRPSSRPYRLLSCLIDPFGAPKTVDAIFKRLKTGKDSSDKVTQTSYRITRIEYAKKELQKIKEFRERFCIIIDKESRAVWLEWKNAIE